MWLPAAELAGLVINSCACLCKRLVAVLFWKKVGAALEATDCSILFAIRSAESAFIAKSRAAQNVSRAREYIIPRGER